MMNKLLEISFGRQPTQFEAQVAEHFFNQGLKAAQGTVEFKPVAALLGGQPKEYKRVERFIPATVSTTLTQSEAMRLKTRMSFAARILQENIKNLRSTEKSAFKFAEKDTLQGQLAFKLLNQTRDEIRALRTELELVNSAIRHFRKAAK